ncbi:MAG: type II secretion system protein [Armatimonadota bacterium]
MTRRAFTLIELLVVISIIAVLAAILFPVFARTREKGRQTSCLSNVCQIGTAVLAYAQDNDETLPDTSYGSAGDYQWPQACAPYLGSWQLLLCPSDGGRTIVANRGAPGSTLSYALSAAYTGGSQVFAPHPVSANGPNGRSLSAIADHAGTILSCEYTGSGEIIWSGIAGQPANLDSFLAPRHNDGENVGFVDGHAKWLKASALASRNADNVLTMWSIEND